MTLLHSFLYTIISNSTPIVLAALGGMLTSKAGMFNLGLEGMMLMSAFFSVYFTNLTGSLAAGLFLAIVITILLGLFMAFMSIRMKADIYVVGLAANMLATGLTTFLGLYLTGMQGTMVFKTAPRLPSLTIPIISNIPILGDFLSGHHIIDYLSIVMPFVIYFVLYKTKFGRQTRAVGLSPWVATTRGIHIHRNQYAAYALCGLLCGLAGAALSLPIAMFSGGLVGMTNGRGWTATAVVIIASGRPIFALFACWVLGAISSLGYILQVKSDVSSRLVMAFPFIAAVAATAVYSARSKLKGLEGH